MPYCDFVNLSLYNKSKKGFYDDDGILARQQVLILTSFFCFVFSFYCSPLLISLSAHFLPTSSLLEYLSLALSNRLSLSSYLLLFYPSPHFSSRRRMATHSSHAYFQFPSNQEEMLFSGWYLVMEAGAG